MSLRDFLNQDVSDVFGRRTADKAVADSASSPQARLDITRSASKLEFLCTSPRLRFFSLDARMGGILSVSRSLSEDKLPTTRVEIPVEANGRKYDLICLYCAEEGDRPWPLAEALMNASPDGNRILRWVFGDDKDRILYKFILPPELEVLDFQPIEREVQTVYTPPTVSQLGAVLRTTLKDRRDAGNALEDLSQALSPETVKAVATLRKQLPARSSVQSAAVTLLAEHLGEVAERAPNPHLVSALCLLLDIEAHAITADGLEAFARASQPLITSQAAMKTVALHYGVTLDERWDARASALPQVTVAADAPARMQEAMARIADRMKRPRDPLQVLGNLVRESPSPRVDALVKLWSVRRDAVPGAIEGLQALADLASASARRMDLGTLTAFCLYAEIESCSLGEERFLAWIEGNETLVLSPYTIQAVATALDLGLVGFTLTDAQRGRPELFAALFNLSPGGLLQGLEKIGDPPGSTCRFLAQPEDAKRDREGWRPNGDVMLRTSMLERQTERELTMFLRLGNTFYACFQSDLDRRRVWKRFGPDVLVTDNPFTFIDGFRVYHFQGSVLAELREPSEADAKTSPLVCRDHRNSISFFHPAEAPPAGGVYRDAELVVHFPATEHLPSLLVEMGGEKMLGRVETGSTDVRKLELLRFGLRRIVTDSEESGPPLNTSGMQVLRQKLQTPRVQQTLRTVVDQRTLEFISTQFMSNEASTLECRIYEPMVKGLRDDDLLEFAAMGLVYELCLSEHTSHRSFHKNYNAPQFRAVLRNQLLHILDAESIQVRAIGCRLLGTAPSIGDTAERGIIEYELLRRLDDADDEVAQEAATALARVALEEELGLPPIWKFRKLDAASAAGAGTSANERAAQLQVVANEIRGWQTRLSSMMVGAVMGAGAAAPPPLRPGMQPPAPSGGLKELATLVLGVRQALAERDPAQGGMLVLTSAQALQRMLIDLAASFSSYGDSLQLPMSGVVADLDARGLDGYLVWLKHESTDERRRRLGDDDADALETFRADDMCTPVPLWIERETPEGTRVSPLFMAIVRRAMEGAVEPIRLALMDEPSGAAGRGDRLLPAPLRLRVFNPASGDFQAFVDEMTPVAQFAFTSREQELLAALSGAVARHARPPEAAPAAVVVDVESEAAEPEAPRPVVIEQEKPEVLKRARLMLETFALPQTYLPQILYVFQETRPASVYDFF